MSKYEELRLKLGKNKVDEVIQELLEIYVENSEVKDTLILTSSEWSEWKMKEIGGLKPPPEAKLRIVYRLLKVISEAESQDLSGEAESNKKKQKKLEENIEKCLEKIENIRKKLWESTDSKFTEKLARELREKQNDNRVLLNKYEKFLLTGAVGVGAYELWKVINSNLESEPDIFTVDEHFPGIEEISSTEEEFDSESSDDENDASNFDFEDDFQV